MADPRNVSTQMSGQLFVDATCINCDTCRQLAPRSFQEVGRIFRRTIQPEGDERLHQAYQALLACPVGSIGTERSDKTRLKQAMSAFPCSSKEACFTAGLILKSPSARTVISSGILRGTGCRFASLH